MIDASKLVGPLVGEDGAFARIEQRRVLEG